MSNNDEQYFNQLDNMFKLGVWRGIAIGLILGSLCTSLIILIVGLLMK